MARRFSLLVIGLALLAQAAVAQYQITSFNVAGGFLNSFAYGLNNYGQVVGSGAPAGYFAPFLYSGGSVVLLSPEFVFDAATAISDTGIIVGNVGFDASYYAGGGLWVPLGSLGSTSFVYDVNVSGLAVGEAYVDDPGAFHAVSYSGGLVTDLGTLGGSQSVAEGVNAAGQIVGNADLAGDVYCHAFLFDYGVMHDLGTLVGAEACSYAYAINGAGQVVGWSDTASGEYHAVLWDPIDGMIDLGSLDGYAFSEASAINASGQIVGNASPYSGISTAFLYSGGTMVRLQDLVVNLSEAGFTDLTQAFAINNSGQIIGIGLDENLNTVGFLLRPVPEPSAAACAALAGLILAFRRRRRD